MTNRKPPELTEEKIESEKGKRFARDVKSCSKGTIYVYQWNVEKSDASPIGLYVDANNIKGVCDNLEIVGAVKLPIQHGNKFDLSIVSGFQGAHVDVYNTGRMNVQWPRNGKDKNQTDFVNSLVDVIEIMSSSFAKGSNQSRKSVNSDKNENEAKKTKSSSSNSNSIERRNKSVKNGDDNDERDDDDNDDDDDNIIMERESGGGGKRVGNGGGGGGSNGDEEEQRSAVDDGDRQENEISEGRSNPVGTKTYPVMPLVLKNHLPPEIKRNPRQLAEILQSLKPAAKFKEICVLQSGDIKVTGDHPHDFGILRQEWPIHDVYGKITPMLPEENSVDQAVLILDVPTSISKNEIQDALSQEQLHPKKIERFTRKGTDEESTTVKVTFSSSEQKAKLLRDRFRIYYRVFNVVDFVPEPEVTQCYRCQDFGHFHQQCRSARQKCLRCGEDHRIRDCPKTSACCANCGGNHVASYRGCISYKLKKKSK